MILAQSWPKTAKSSRHSSFKIAWIMMIQMMIWASVRTGATQDVGTKSIGSSRVHRHFWATERPRTTESKKICVKIPIMVKTLRCDWKDQLNPPVLAFRKELPVIHGEALPEKGVARFWKKDAFCRLKVC